MRYTSSPGCLIRSSTFPILNGEIKRQIKGWDIIVKKRTEIKSYFEDIDEQINYNDISSSDVLFFIANSYLLANETTDWNFTENMTKEKNNVPKNSNFMLWFVVVFMMFLYWWFLNR